MIFTIPHDVEIDLILLENKVIMILFIEYPVADIDWAMSVGSERRAGAIVVVVIT